MNKRDRNMPCLFLDRDGVINKRMPDDYVKHWDQFYFLPHVLNVLRELKKYFHPIVVVTNQQGIGKGLMSASDVESIHQKMRRIVRKQGGRIDKVFYCPDLMEPPSPCRKPNPGMGRLAKTLYPAIQFERAVLVGDSISDVLFGKNLGMVSILLDPQKNDSSGKADFVFKDLLDFYLNFVKKSKTGSFK